jgi:hypothetical protein
MLIMTLHASVAYSYMTREGAVVDIERTAAFPEGARNNTGVPLSIYSLQTPDDFMQWIQNGFIDRVEGSALKKYNKIIGSILLTQRRTVTEDCKVDPELQKDFYGAQCHPMDKISIDSYGPAENAAAEIPMGLYSPFIPRGGLENGEDDRFY